MMMNLTKTKIFVNFFRQSVEHKLTPACWTLSTVRNKSTAPDVLGVPKKVKTPDETEKKRFNIPQNYRYTYPEFLPDPHLWFRNPVREQIERQDMIDRRRHIDIPEFHVGSIMAVTHSEPDSAGKMTRFVGICIHRYRCGLRARFILRNVIDHQGMEVQYQLYDPTIRKIEVLRLEKRLDADLFYLRDALPEYSTFDVNMEAETLADGLEVPVNPLKVKLKPRPWLERWERQGLKGVENVEEHCSEKMLRRRVLPMHTRPWEKYDLMKEYRRTIPEEEQQSIYSEIYPQLNELHKRGKVQKRKRAYVKPTKTA